MTIVWLITKTLTLKLLPKQPRKTTVLSSLTRYMMAQSVFPKTKGLNYRTSKMGSVKNISKQKAINLMNPQKTLNLWSNKTRSLPLSNNRQQIISTMKVYNKNCRKIFKLLSNRYFKIRRISQISSFLSKITKKDYKNSICLNKTKPRKVVLCLKVIKCSFKEIKQINSYNETLQVLKY